MSAPLKIRGAKLYHGDTLILEAKSPIAYATFDENRSLVACCTQEGAVYLLTDPLSRHPRYSGEGPKNTAAMAVTERRGQYLVAVAGNGELLIAASTYEDRTGTLYSKGRVALTAEHPVAGLQFLPNGTLVCRDAKGNELLVVESDHKWRLA